MPIQEAIGKLNSLVSNIGKVGLNSLFPNDFEVYVIAFELIDSSDNTVEFFSMPILPNTITINSSELTNIKKTARGVVSLKTDSFVPTDISLNGNFGRNFKILLRDKIIDFTSFKGVLGLSQNDFNGPNIKNGYGTTKVFSRILDGSKQLDSKGLPLRLYFYNFTFGDNYVVEVVDKSFTQSRDSSNMIWNYSVNLRAVAPINNSNLKFKNSLLGIVASSTLQRGLNVLSGDVQRYMKKQTPKVKFI